MSSPARELERKLRRQGAEIQYRSKHLVVCLSGTPVATLPRAAVGSRGRQHINTLATLRRAGFDV